MNAENGCLDERDTAALIEQRSRVAKLTILERAAAVLDEARSELGRSPNVSKTFANASASRNVRPARRLGAICSTPAPKSTARSRIQVAARDDRRGGARGTKAKRAAAKQNTEIERLEREEATFVGETPRNRSAATWPAEVGDTVEVATLGKSWSRPRIAKRTTPSSPSARSS